MRKPILLFYIRWIINIGLTLCVALYFFAKWQVKTLPDTELLSEEVLTEPLQSKLYEQSPFTLDYKNQSYQIDPVATYDISGLVVSHNDISAWWDIYHDKNSLDTKDLCLAWGKNLTSGDYLKGSYYNESVSCHAFFQPGTNHVGLSNNHLITDSDQIRKEIEKIRVGNQVRIRGQLVNYSFLNNPSYKRKTSTNRTDRAGGACEVIFVESIEILETFNQTWFKVYDICKAWLLPLLFIKILSFLLFPWIEFKNS